MSNSNNNNNNNNNNGKKRYAFTCDEDDRLRELVNKYGENGWSQIAAKMKKRTVRQCRDRWFYYLCPAAINGAWSPEEDQLLSEKVEQYGRKWKMISTQFFPGRTDINVKNHWNFLKKQELRIKNKFFSTNNNNNNNSQIQSQQMQIQHLPQQQSHNMQHVQLVQNVQHAQHQFQQNMQQPVQIYQITNLSNGCDRNVKNCQECSYEREMFMFEGDEEKDALSNEMSFEDFINSLDFISQINEIQFDSYC